MTWILSLCLGAGSWATCQRYIEYEYPTKPLCDEARVQMKDAVGTGYAICHPKFKEKTQ